jgi:hypothetical protein
MDVHLANGLPALHIVGLPETAAKESKDRARAALLNARFEFPMRCIRVSLAPADLSKESGRFYLPIALSILAAFGQIPTRGLESYEFVGELGLSGELRPIRGACPWRCRRRSQRTRSSCRVAMPMRPRSFRTVRFWPPIISCRSVRISRVVGPCPRISTRHLSIIGLTDWTWLTYVVSIAPHALYKSPRPAATICSWSDTRNGQNHAS